MVHFRKGALDLFMIYSLGLYKTLAILYYRSNCWQRRRFKI